jgi:glucose/arabinose dehydrogenase
MRTRVAACVCAWCVIAKRRKDWSIQSDHRRSSGGTVSRRLSAFVLVRMESSTSLLATPPIASSRRNSTRSPAKTLRLNDDGTVPQDNPFVGQQNVRPEIWSLGHRNAQGMDWQPGSNLMFQTEHGPSGFDGPGGGDEVNIVEKGKNYGWPIIHHTQTREGLESPLLEYTPACAPASGMFYRGSVFPKFKGKFLFRLFALARG